MKKIQLVVLAVASLVLSSCEKSADNHVVEKEVVLNWNQLDSRISNEGAGVVGKKNVPEMPVDFYSENSAQQMSTKAALASDDVASDFPLVLTAQLEAPEYEGILMQATHVVVVGNYAYVSYNVQGPRHLGAIDVIDITDPESPQLAVEAIFPWMDISSLVIKDNYLYFVGARNPDEYDGLTNAATLGRMALSGGMLTETIDYIELPSYVGTDLVAGDQNLYCVSGDEGAVVAISLSAWEEQSQVGVSDLRTVGLYENELVGLSGTSGVHVFDPATLNEKRNFATSTDVADAKRTIDFHNEYLLAAEGFQGTGIYKLENGELLTKLPVESLEGAAAEDLVCNAVKVASSHILMAQGAAGLVVYSMVDGGIEAPENLGSLALEGSANYVQAGTNCLFIADGTGGLKILQVLCTETPSEGDYDCENYPAYDGSSWLNINSGEPASYSSSNTLAGLNVNDQLIWCGDLAVQGGVNINSGGELDVNGKLSVGSGWDWFNINSTVVVTGNLTVYGSLNLNSTGTLEMVGNDLKITVNGDLYLNSGATINFAGTGGSIAVTGNVINNGGQVTGSYTDLSGKIKK